MPPSFTVKLRMYQATRHHNTLRARLHDVHLLWYKRLPPSAYFLLSPSSSSSPSSFPFPSPSPVLQSDHPPMQVPLITMSSNIEKSVQKASPFFTLPPELRIQIYEHALSSTAKFPLKVSLKGARYSIKQNELSLLRVNRQIYKEASPIAYQGAVADFATLSSMCRKAMCVAKDIKSEENGKLFWMNLSPEHQTPLPQTIHTGTTLLFIKKITLDITTFMLLAGVCKECELSRAFVLATLRDGDAISYLAKRLTNVTHIEVNDDVWSRRCFIIKYSTPWLAQILNHKGDGERVLEVFPNLEQITVSCTSIGLEQYTTKEDLMGFERVAKECPRAGVAPLMLEG